MPFLKGTAKVTSFFLNNQAFLGEDFCQTWKLSADKHKKSEKIKAEVLSFPQKAYLCPPFGKNEFQNYINSLSLWLFQGPDRVFFQNLSYNKK